MDFEIKGNFTVNVPQILRKCGYFSNYDSKSGETSFIRKLGSGFYPRFHIYIKDESAGRVFLNLHLDMKKASYGEYTRHSGEYDSEVVHTEHQRVLEIFKSLQSVAEKIVLEDGSKVKRLSLFQKFLKFFDSKR